MSGGKYLNPFFQFTDVTLGQMDTCLYCVIYFHILPKICGLFVQSNFSPSYPVRYLLPAWYCSRLIFSVDFLDDESSLYRYVGGSLRMISSGEQDVWLSTAEMWLHLWWLSSIPSKYSQSTTHKRKNTRHSITRIKPTLNWSWNDTNKWKSSKTSGYATWFTAGGPIRIAHYDVVDDVITRKL